MEAGIALFALVALALFIGAILGWVSYFKLNRLEIAVERLRRLLEEGEREAITAAPPPSATRTPAAAPPSPPPSTLPRPASAQRVEPPEPVDIPPPAAPGFTERLIENVRENWMVWLGGISVALAGIFLVGYSIEMGLLGPSARIAAAIIGGLALHGVAEWLRRKTGSAHPAFAALAGGASITLYAAVFAALELYSMLSAGFAFTLLAVVSLLTMALALIHGPMLAIIGILGAYLVPILVAEDTGNILVALIYSSIITTAALFLIRFVYRPWLWYGMLVGALGWWLVSLSSADADGFRGIYLAVFAYLALAVPVLDWPLRRTPADGDPATDSIPLGETWSIQTIQLTILVLALAQAVSIADLGFTSAVESLLEWSPLIVVVLWASRKRELLRFAPWVLLITQWFAWLSGALDAGDDGVRLVGLEAASQTSFLWLAVAMALLFSFGARLAARGKPFSHVSASLIWLAPLLWLALAYLLVTDLSAAWHWSLATLGLGLVYIYVSDRRLRLAPNDGAAIWLILGAHLAYSLAAAMYFREATLTLALAAQLISLAWLNRRFELAALPWIVKGVLALVVARLTLNPWLLTYPADQHWSLWTYGGSMLCCVAAALGTPSRYSLKKWLEAASLHLLVLFLGAEVRYWLYDGRIFIDEYTLTEVAINTSLWGGLALAYFYRSRASEHLQAFYVACSRVLMVLALLAYGMALTELNPLSSDEPVAATKLWNILLLAYAAPVLIALAAYRFYEPRFKKIAAYVAGGGLFVFVTMEIRHLWHGALDLRLPTTNGEVYTYSATWMVMAVATILAATRLGSRDGYRAGMGLLFVVIAKIFLIDMSDLEGLLRVASFMGLGLALLGLAYLYQRIAQRAR